ncbi:MAG: imidazole glycerol phosphate synthase subunit HisH [Phycisphaeraceae bacterium]|mgnify:CR=1 FL=1|nr:imidazole glycerol phosphate synthase subunit HisH [Phycisphaeraceae bacterium]
MIGIIDYGMGNLRSVQKAFESLGSQATILTTPDMIDTQVSHLVLPGVGAFGDGMTHLRDRGWIAPINDFYQSGKPMLGICLGMQLLMDSSEEDAPSRDQPIPGLGMVKGTVKLFAGDAYGPGKLKVPHMGWNSLNIQQDVSLFAGAPENPHVYFVHGYYCSPSDSNVIIATTDYGSPFCSSLKQDNLWATQFHPEKSQRVGLKMLENFAAC